MNLSHGYRGMRWGRFVLLMRILDVSRGNQRICRISTATQAARLQGLVLPEVARPIRGSTPRDKICPAHYPNSY